MASIKIKDVQSQSISEETYSLCKVLAEAMPLLQKKKLKKKKNWSFSMLVSPTWTVPFKI